MSDDEYDQEEDSTVVYLDKSTTLPIPVSRVLQGALEKNLDMVVVLGYEQDGTPYAAASTGDGREILWVVASFQHDLLSGSLLED
jgi:hypothetical protein